MGTYPPGKPKNEDIPETQLRSYLTTSSGLAGAFPLIFILLMTVFELGIAFLQAYIYTILTGIYLGEMIQESH